jgi:hypothetical protein
MNGFLAKCGQDDSQDISLDQCRADPMQNKAIPTANEVDYQDPYRTYQQREMQ